MVVGTDWMLFFSNICVNCGPKNSLPLSCRYLFGLGYLLNYSSSKAIATVLEVALSTGITSGKLIMESMHVSALKLYSMLFIVIFHGPIISTHTLHPMDLNELYSLGVDVHTSLFVYCTFDSKHKI